jgi:hypothetical protein
MRDSLNFLFATPVDYTRLARHSHRLFPLECAKYFASHWELVPEAQRMSLLGKLPHRLKSVANDAVAGVWCEILSSHPEYLANSELATTVTYLTTLAKSFLHKSNHESVKLDVMFSNFLLRSAEDSVVDFVKGMSPLHRRIYAHSNPAMSSFLATICPDHIPGEEPELETAEAMAHDPIPEPEMPTEDSEIQNFFEFCVAEGKIGLIKRVIGIAAEKHIQLDISKASFRPETVSVVAELLAKSQPKTFDVIQAIDHVRTDWRPLAIAALANSGEALLNALIAQQKMSRRHILALCSIVGIVPFDDELLLNVASSLVSNAVTSRRIFATVHFLSVVLEHVDVVPSSLMLQFGQVVQGQFESIFGLSLSLALLQIVRKVTPDAQFVALVKRAFDISGNKTTANGRLHQTLIACARVPDLISKQFMIQLADIIQPYLTSVLPSLYAAGLRIFEEAARLYPPERCVVGLRTAIDIVADRFVRMSAVPIVPDLQYKAVMSILLKPKVPSMQAQQFKLMPQRFSLPENSPGYATAVWIWPTVIRLIPKDIDSFKRVLQSVDVLFASALGFDAAIATFKEKWPRVPVRERGGFIVAIVKIWIKFVSESPDYTTIRKMAQLYDLVMEHEPKVLDLVTTTFIKTVKPFWVVFANIVRVFIKMKRSESFLEGARMAATSLDKLCHKNALFLLTDTTNLKNVIRLSQFLDDCDESDRLAQDIDQTTV